MIRDEEPTRPSAGGAADLPLVHQEVYANRYRVGRPLGSGGMAQVYQVRDTVSDTDLALKIIHASADDPDRVDRFKREIGVLSRTTIGSSRCSGSRRRRRSAASGSTPSSTCRRPK